MKLHHKIISGVMPSSRKLLVEPFRLTRCSIVLNTRNSSSLDFTCYSTMACLLRMLQVLPGVSAIGIPRWMP